MQSRDQAKDTCSVIYEQMYIVQNKLSNGKSGLLFVSNPTQL